jgi:hypothetical protein
MILQARRPGICIYSWLQTSWLGGQVLVIRFSWSEIWAEYWFSGVFKNIFWSLLKACSFYCIRNPEFLILHEKFYKNKNPTIWHLQLLNYVFYIMWDGTVSTGNLQGGACCSRPTRWSCQVIKNLMALIPSTQTSLVGNSQAATLCNSWAATTTPAGVSWDCYCLPHTMKEQF